MSHWTKCKSKNKCSISIMKKAIIKIMPKWEQFIKIDESGKLRMYNTYTSQFDKDTYHIVIPGGYNAMGKKEPPAPGLNYADLGFKKDEEGSWIINIDPLGAPAGLGDKITEEALKMTAENEARLKGWRTYRDDDNDVVILRPVESRHRTRIMA